MNSTKYVLWIYAKGKFLCWTFKNRYGTSQTAFRLVSKSNKEVKLWPILLLMIAQTVQHVKIPAPLTLLANRVESVLLMLIHASTAEHVLIPVP